MEDLSDGGNNHGGVHEMKAPGSEAPVHQVVAAAHEELLQLMRQRAEIMKRIGTVKQTIAGLANLLATRCWATTC